MTPPPTPRNSGEHRATLRIDVEPGGKKFQGVWLELAPDKRWVIDYRPRELWRGFEDSEVIVTGHCYRPFGQAISGTHFHVDRLRFASAPKRSVPYFEIGPEVLMTGKFVAIAAPAGSKLAGSSETRFESGGVTYGIAGATDTLPGASDAAIEARGLELNMAYRATTGGPHLWVMAVHAPGYAPDASTGPTTIPCP